MEDKGKIIYKVSSPAWIPLLVLVIWLGIMFIWSGFRNGFEFERIIVAIGCIGTFVGIFIGFCNNISVYEKCIVIGKREIRYEDILRIEINEKVYDTGVRSSEWNGQFNNEIFLMVEYKNGGMEEFLISTYTIKQKRKIVNYIGAFSKCDVFEANQFLDKIDKKTKKDIIIAISIFVSFIIICIIFGKGFMEMCSKL